MVVFHPILLSQTLSRGVIQPYRAHHNGRDVQSSCVRSCINISVMSVFSHRPLLVTVCHWRVIFP